MGVVRICHLRESRPSCNQNTESPNGQRFGLFAFRLLGNSCFEPAGWDLAAQATPDFEVHQRINGWLSEAAISTAAGSS